MNEKDKKKSITITLSKEDIRDIKRIGKGNVSEGVRQLIKIFK